MQFTSEVKVSLFQHIITKSTGNEMCVPIKKIFMSFKNCFSLLSRLCQGKEYKPFVKSHVSMNITHCRGPHSVRELRAEAVCTKGCHSGIYEDCSLQRCVYLQVYA